MVHRAHETLLLMGILGCAGVAEPGVDDAISSRQHLIPLDEGLALLQRGFDSANQGARAADPRLLGERYAADVFREVVEQQEARTLIVSPRRDEAGVATFAIGVRDAAGKWLPDGLLASEVAQVAASGHWLDEPSVLVAKAREPIAYFWYDAAQAREFARSALASVSVALGETPDGKPTPVMLGIEEALGAAGSDNQPASAAFDGGYPCPPYCLQDEDPSEVSE